MDPKVDAITQLGGCISVILLMGSPFLRGATSFLLLTLCCTLVLRWLIRR